MKICSKCGESKPIDNFRLQAKNGKNKNYRRTYCLPCDREYERVNRRDYRKNWQLKNHYGITLEQYKEMLKEQNGLCAICGNPETDKIGETLSTLAVDHDHETGRVRGLLCKKCNTAIGLFFENIDTIKKAIKYLKRKELYA
jgi:hypothetical protein